MRRGEQEGGAGAWRASRSLAGAEGPRGSSVFPFAHTAAFSAHSPSCLLRASLAGATENCPALGYQPGLLKVTSLPPRAQQGLAKAHHSPLEIITSQLAEWQGAWREPGTSSLSSWAGKWLEQHPIILSPQRIHRTLCLPSPSPRPRRGFQSSRAIFQPGTLQALSPLGQETWTELWAGLGLLTPHSWLRTKTQEPDCMEFKFSCVTLSEQLKPFVPGLIPIK